MKVVAKPIQVVAWFDEAGNPHPVRFKITNEDSSTNVIKIDKVCFCQKEKIAGNLMLVYNCQSLINGEIKPFEIKYEISTCKWILFKI